MNRLVLIGNGFDLAHRLDTSYKDFIDWYWEKVIYELRLCYFSKWSDNLCSFDLKYKGETWQCFMYTHVGTVNPPKGVEIIQEFLNNKEIFNIEFSQLFQEIYNSFESKKWVDIENDYYRCLCTWIDSDKDKSPEELNNELAIVRKYLAEYLIFVQKGALSKIIVNKNLKDAMFAPIRLCEVAVGAKESLRIFVTNRLKDPDFSLKNLYDKWDKEWNSTIISNISKKIKGLKDSLNYQNVEDLTETEIPDSFLLPENMMLLNFNYTEIADQYVKDSDFEVNHIHGNLDNTQGLIFGYGDELDDNYKKIQNLNDNEYLKNSKSVRYLESDNYRKMLSFIEAAPYQIYIMGHSCGNSDRTLLNTLFEHKNCVSIKPFYYKKDDGSDTYLEMVQNMSRNFTDPKLMRDRVVNKEFCKPLTQV